MNDFNRSEEAKQIFKEKRKPKNPISFKIQLNDEQKLAKQVILDSPVTLLRGMAGSGKTLVACQVALDLVFKKDAERIIITRPTVAKEEIGFLPGDLKEKIDPYLRPLYDALDDMLPADKLSLYMEKNIIEIVPLAYMRGRTLNNAYIILDEAQNATEAQLKMLLTRMGIESRIIVTGDETQIDLPKNLRSGLIQAQKILKDIPGIAFIRLSATDVLRHRIIKKILAAYERADSEKS
jgi:phosphate starvation-inducible PhoH-like protein